MGERWLHGCRRTCAPPRNLEQVGEVTRHPAVMRVIALLWSAVCFAGLGA